MAIHKADYYKVKMRQRAGEGAKLLVALRKEGVNLLALHAFPERGGAQVDLVPEDAAALRRAAKKLDLKLGQKKSVFLVQGRDRVGALAAALDKLAKAKVNVTALSAATGGWKRYGAMFWVKPKDLARASRALRARARKRK